MVADLAAAVFPYLNAVVDAYGTQVLAKVQDAALDETAGATVGLGRRILQSILRSESSASVESAVTDLAAAPIDDDFQAALRAQVKKALAADVRLVVNVRQILSEAGVTVTASGERSVAVYTNHGIIQTGDRSKVEQ